MEARASTMENQPASGQRHSVWEVVPGEQRSAGIIHGLLSVFLLVLAEVTARLCSFPLQLPLPLGKSMVTWFSPATTVQVVGGMWFGMWGVIAGTFFLVVGDLMNGEPALTLLLLPVNIVQRLTPAWIFRHWRLDPRLATATDLGDLGHGRPLGAWATFWFLVDHPSRFIHHRSRSASGSVGRYCTEGSIWHYRGVQDLLQGLVGVEREGAGRWTLGLE